MKTLALMAAFSLSLSLSAADLPQAPVFNSGSPVEQGAPLGAQPAAPQPQALPQDGNAELQALRQQLAQMQAQQQQLQQQLAQQGQQQAQLQQAQPQWQDLKVLPTEQFAQWLGWELRQRQAGQMGHPQLRMVQTPTIQQVLNGGGGILGFAKQNPEILALGVQVAASALDKSNASFGDIISRVGGAGQIADRAQSGQAGGLLGRGGQAIGLDAARPLQDLQRQLPTIAFALGQGQQTGYGYGPQPGGYNAQPARYAPAPTHNGGGSAYPGQVPPAGYPNPQQQAPGAGYAPAGYNGPQAAYPAPAGVFRATPVAR